jgi:transcriptional regulator with XRE-family HTH domain
MSARSAKVGWLRDGRKMPINTDGDFGARLRAFRERQGITLEAIADSTKIRRSFLADLERNDLSRWPGGIYRRGFVREYAKAVGLPASATVDEFCQLFPESTESETRPSPDRKATKASSAEWRLTLAGAPRPTLETICARTLDAVSMLGSVLTAGAVVRLVGDLPFWTASGLVALVSYPIAAVAYSNGVSLRRMLTSLPFQRWSPFPRVRHLLRAARHLPSHHQTDRQRIVDTVHISPIDGEHRVDSLSSVSPTIH